MSGAGTYLTGGGPGGVSVWNDSTSTPIALVPNQGYLADRVAGPVTFTLPIIAIEGSVISIAGIQNGWVITQNTGQKIHCGNQTTILGVAGTITSTNAFDAISLLCIAANATWTTLSVVGVPIVA